MIGMREYTADDFTFVKKPFYTPLEVAKILEISDQAVLDRIHDDRLGAVQLGPRLYRIPLGALMQYLGVKPTIIWTSKPNLIDDAVRDEETTG